jgi:hypothetical protein
MLIKQTSIVKKENARWWHPDIANLQLKKAMRPYAKEYGIKIPDMDIEGIMEIVSRVLNEDNNELTTVRHWTLEGWQFRKKYIDKFEYLKKCAKKEGFEITEIIEYIT